LKYQQSFSLIPKYNILVVLINIKWILLNLLYFIMSSFEDLTFLRIYCFTKFSNLNNITMVISFHAKYTNLYNWFWNHVDNANMNANLLYIIIFISHKGTNFTLFLYTLYFVCIYFIFLWKSQDIFICFPIFWIIDCLSSTWKRNFHSTILVVAK